ncbi:hypothetical protein ES705_08775 [subsurface metagenome]
MVVLENNKDTNSFEVFSFRWVVLFLFILVGIINQVIWITFAPLTNESALFYETSDNLILLLAMIFMVVYIPVNYPASRLIDKLGLKWGTGIGVILTGVFGFLRAIAPNYAWLLVFQIGCAIGQPFILNSFTKVATNWFPEKEKTLATGLGTLAVLLGAILGMLLTPIFYDLFNKNFTPVLYIYGGVALASMAFYLIFVKDKPPSPPNAYSDKTKIFEIKGTRNLFRNRDFILLFSLMFIGIGVFNAISSGVDVLFVFSDELYAGIIGGLLIIGGVFGAVILSALSDKFHKRKIFLIIAVTSSAFLVILFYFIENFIALCILSFVFGFLLISALPIALTYAAEITYPIPESTSNGWMMWAGQISGILLILGVMYLPSVKTNFIIYAVLFAVGIVLTIFMKDISEYKHILTED